jgi:hypothetical protein
MHEMAGNCERTHRFLVCSFVCDKARVCLMYANSQIHPSRGVRVVLMQIPISFIHLLTPDWAQLKCGGVRALLNAVVFFLRTLFGKETLKHICVRK